MSEWVPKTPAIDALLFPQVIMETPCIAAYFWASWEGGSRILDKLLGTIGKENPSDLIFRSINLDDEINWTLAHDLDILNLPTLVCLIKGELRDRFVGFANEILIREKVQAWNSIAALFCASESHKAITDNIISALQNLRTEQTYQVYNHDLCVTVIQKSFKTYPDVTVVCGEQHFHPLDTGSLINPTVLFEILSPTTEAHDRGEKWANYRKLDSLHEYILVSQDQILVEHFVRQEDDSWKFTAPEGRDASIFLPSLNCTLPLAEVYDRVVFDETPQAGNAEE